MSGPALMTETMVEKYGQPVSLQPLSAIHPTVSGFSSGGYMAHQLHVAYSDFFEGVGIAAGGPFACSSIAGFYNCATPPDPDVVSERLLLMNATKYQYEGKIAALSNLVNNHVWIFSGTKDTTVFPSIVTKTYQFYKDIGTQNLLFYNWNQSTHSFPSTDPYSPISCNGNNF
jgi:hypothetical protein